MDLVTYFRDNHIVVGESDCFMLVKQLDSNNDGALNLTDFSKLLCPSTYTTSDNLKAARKHHVYAK